MFLRIFTQVSTDVFLMAVNVRIFGLRSANMANFLTHFSAFLMFGVLIVISIF